MPPDPKGIPTLGTLAEDFLERRKITHRAAKDDRYRWDNHLAPHFAGLKPTDVGTATLRAFIEAKLAEGLAPGTVKICMAILSSLFEDLVERDLARANPCRTLPRSVRRLTRPSYDSRGTPFIEKLDDVRRVYLALPEPVCIAFALGALAGLRTGEAIALRWEHVDLAARRIHVRESVEGPLKDKESRAVLVLDSLMPILNAWKLKTGGRGLVVPPMPGAAKAARHISRDALWDSLRAVLKDLGFPEAARTPGTDRTLTWYRATRHTFASHWVMSGGSIEKLKELLGHASVTITERYAHLRVDLFAGQDLGTISLDLGAGSAAPVPIGQTLGSGLRNG